MIFGKCLTFIRSIPIKSYPYQSILRQFTHKNIFLEALYLREKTLLSTNQRKVVFKLPLLQMRNRVWNLRNENPNVHTHLIFFLLKEKKKKKYSSTENDLIWGMFFFSHHSKSDETQPRHNSDNCLKSRYFYSLLISLVVMEGFNHLCCSRGAVCPINI